MYNRMLSWKYKYKRTLFLCINQSSGEGNLFSFFLPELPPYVFFPGEKNITED
jgi:hypothetical protein